MTDITERLRKMADLSRGLTGVRQLVREAADEIDRLRDDLRIHLAALEVMERAAREIEESRESQPDDREALIEVMYRFGTRVDDGIRIADCVLAAGFHRSVASPVLPTREALADEISGIVVGSGYYSTNIGIDAAREAADIVLALLKEQTA